MVVEQEDNRLCVFFYLIYIVHVAGYLFFWD